MIFIDEIFRFMVFEETLMFTELDIALNSFKKGEEVSEDALLQISKSALQKSFSCDLLPQISVPDKPLSKSSVE